MLQSRSLSETLTFYSGGNIRGKKQQQKIHNKEQQEQTKRNKTPTKPLNFIVLIDIFYTGIAMWVDVLCEEYCFI